MGLIRTILIIVLIYYAFKWFAKYITPILLKRFMSKYGMNSESWNDRNKQYTQKEGEVNIKNQPQHKKKFDGGEYVDYEDVKE